MTAQFLVQDDTKIEIPAPTYEGLPNFSAITAGFCDIFTVFDGHSRFTEHCANRLWLDSTSPPEKEDQPGGARGPCPSDFRHPRRRRVVEARRVVWSEIRFGSVGSSVDV
ncbi:hypothetical protein VUR80DRAFT_10229 [Thermomyces stellatus]